MSLEQLIDDARKAYLSGEAIPTQGVFDVNNCRCVLGAAVGGHAVAREQGGILNTAHRKYSLTDNHLSGCLAGWDNSMEKDVVENPDWRQAYDASKALWEEVKHLAEKESKTSQQET